MSDRDPGARLRGRRSECETLDRLLEGVRAGQSRVLVVRGEAGIGKSALLEYLLARASGCRIAQAAGVESEMELPFSGLHQLCAPLLDRRERLPKPQLQTESKFERAIKAAKRPDCKDGVPGGLLAPIFLAMDKKDSGCKW